MDCHFTLVLGSFCDMTLPCAGADMECVTSVCMCMAGKQEINGACLGIF